LSILTFGQITTKNIFFENIILKDSSSSVCIISFKVAYDQLVFIKDNSKYTAKFSLTFEAEDSLKEIFKREIIEKILFVDNYEITSRKIYSYRDFCN